MARLIKQLYIMSLTGGIQARIFGDLDSGLSGVEVYALHGGTQDAETKAIIPLYYQFQGWAVQTGTDAAFDRLVTEIEAICGR